MAYWQKLVTVGLVGMAAFGVVTLAYEKLVAPRLRKDQAALGRTASVIAALVLSMSVQVALGWMPAFVLLPTFVGALCGALVGRGVRKSLGSRSD